MTLAVQYARPVEVFLWDEEKNPSVYVVPFERKSVVEVQKVPYTCKIFLNKGEPSDIEGKKMEVSYYRVPKVNLKQLRVEARDMQREIVMDEVRTFANYSDDWDGYGAIRPLSECLHHALEIIRNKNIRLDYLADIYPNPNGTLSLEWEQDENEIGLELGKDEFSYFAHFGKYHSYNNRKPYVAEEIERLAEFVSYMR